MRWNVKSLFPENEKKYQEKEKEKNEIVTALEAFVKLDKASK